MKGKDMLHLVLCFVVGLAIVSRAGAVDGDPVAISGPYITELQVFPLNSDIKNPEEDKVSVFYPVGAKPGSNATVDKSFKFISYAHGMFGGGILEVPAYNDLLHHMASFGYVIGATHQCSVGCFDDCVSLENDPICFGNYYKKQLATIDWAKDCTAAEAINSCSHPFENVDWSSGVGVAGHSMGGQATLFSSSGNNASSYDIRAAVLHHAYTHTFPVPTVPFLDMTGEEDTTATVDGMAIPIYNAASASGIQRGLIDKTLAGHHEPDITSLDRNGIQLVAQFSSAWFKLYLDKTAQAYGLDFYDMIYGTEKSSICNGGDGCMKICKLE